MSAGNIFCQPHVRDVSEGSLIDLSNERDAWLRRIAAESQASYLAGYADGDRAGFERGARLLEATHPAIARPLQGPSLAELELLRWGPGGREHFGEPKPGDWLPGQAVAA